MKSIVKTVFVATMIAAPLASFAQSSQPTTRAQVREELTQLRKAGYNPSDWINYPSNIQHAEAIVAQQDNSNTGYGANTGSTSQTGK